MRFDITSARLLASASFASVDTGLSGEALRLTAIRGVVTER